MEDWLADTGGTHHVTPDRRLFQNLEPSPLHAVTVANEESTPILGQGNVDLEVQGESLTLKNVQYAPGMRQNILSGGQLAKAG